MRVLVLASLTVTTLAGLSPCFSSLGHTDVFQFDASGHATRTLPNNRTYLVHIPADYGRTLPINIPHPVVLSYHGNGGTSAKQEVLSQWSESNVKLNGRGVIGVYPQASTGLSRNGGKPAASWQGAPYASPDAHDIEFTQTILDELKENLCIDERRIYATGKSNGGGFAQLLACTSSTARRLAAVALVSGAYYPDTFPDDGCTPGKSLPVYISHGVVDQTIPYLGRPFDSSGSTDYRTPNIDDFAARWAARNGLSADDFCQTRVHVDAVERVWGNGLVHRIRVDGLGHSWPTTLGLDASGAPNNTASFNLTSAHLVSFFNTHILPLALEL